MSRRRISVSRKIKNAEITHLARLEKYRMREAECCDKMCRAGSASYHILLASTTVTTFPDTSLAIIHHNMCYNNFQHNMAIHGRRTWIFSYKTLKLCNSIVTYYNKLYKISSNYYPILMTEVLMKIPLKFLSFL